MGSLILLIECIYHVMRAKNQDLRRSTWVYFIIMQRQPSLYIIIYYHLYVAVINKTLTEQSVEIMEVR